MHPDSQLQNSALNPDDLPLPAPRFISPDDLDYLAAQLQLYYTHNTPPADTSPQAVLDAWFALSSAHRNNLRRALALTLRNFGIYTNPPQPPKPKRRAH